MAQLVKTVAGLAIASVKTVNGLAIASVKTIAGLDNTSGGGGGLAFVQTKENSDLFNSTTTITLTPTGAFTAGNLVHVVAWWSSATATVSFTDGTNTYNLVAGSKAAGNGYSLQSAYALNVAGSTPTITATFSGAVDNKGIALIEISGANTTTQPDGQKGIANTSVAGGANTVDSGTFTTSTNGDMLIAAMMVSDFSGTTATAGTLSQAYTLRSSQNGSGQMFYVETAVQTTASASTKATFSPAAFTGNHMLSVVAYKP